MKSEIVKNRRLFGVLELFSRRIKKKPTFKYGNAIGTGSVKFLANFDISPERNILFRIGFAVLKGSSCEHTVTIGVIVKAHV